MTRAARRKGDGHCPQGAANVTSGLPARGQAGFTIIELLVVMIIIGILAAVAIPVYLIQKKKGYDASVKSDLRTYAREIDAYEAEFFAYPATTGFTQATGGVLTVAPGLTVRVATTVTFGYYVNTGKSAFCLVAVNSKGTRPFEYISSLGGLQPTATFPAGTTLPTACSTTAY